MTDMMMTMVQHYTVLPAGGTSTHTPTTTYNDNKTSGNINQAAIPRFLHYRGERGVEMV